MKTIFIKHKNVPGLTLQVYDELIPGLLSGEFLVILCNGSVFPVSYYVEWYAWPITKTDGIASFLACHSPWLAAKIEYYEA